LAKIDGPNSISVVYYLARVWGPNAVIDVLLELCTEVKEEDQTLLFSCIADIIQNCNDWKRDANKIRAMLESMGMTVNYVKSKGIVLERKGNLSKVSVFDCKEADMRTLQLFKIAMYS
jgi:hypothetical protein